MKQNLSTCLICFLMVVSLPAAGQSTRSYIAGGDKALSGYNFEAARGDYTRALEQSSDSTERVMLLEKITWCENGQNMLKYASRPKVLSSITVPRSRFFLYYSHFPDKAWKKNPDGAPFLFTDDMDKVIIPVRGEFGTYDLNISSRMPDGRWSPLADMGEGVNSVEDDILPVLADGGKKVYFSSKGLYGMGGYDLFVSEWDESRQRWTDAQNLGFPYSSPYDDLLFCNTPDGNFSLFASNRACSADSVVIYLLQYDPNPVKSAVESVEQARMIAALKPRPDILMDIDESQFVHAMYGDDSFAKYYALVGRYGAVKDSIGSLQRGIASYRAALAGSEEDERESIAQDIVSAEDLLFNLQSRLGDISVELQAVEMEFLVRGEPVSPEELNQADIQATMASSATPAGGAAQYPFIQRTMGIMPDFDFVQPEVKIDMSFRIEDEAMLLTDFTLPDNLVYQIQLAATVNRLTVARLKGLSPAFEFRSGGKYIYRVGLFDTYAEANKHLSAVKKKGFSSAIVVAFDGGKNINLKAARALEAKRAESQKYRVVFRGYPDGLPAAVLGVVRSNSEVDIARGIENGRTIYFVAPLERAAAEKLRDAAAGAGAEGVEVELVNQ
ncbi:MAG: SPOR domain-containing protein [Bacteroidales bacterium]|nr:SPOR domain-containing protein [Bacteroidales bacterium]